MASINNTVKKIHRIKEIITGLPKYQDHISPTYYPWLSAEGLQERIGDTEAFLQAQEDLDEQERAAADNYRDARDLLEDKIRVTKYLIKAALADQDKADDFSSFMVKSRDPQEVANGLIQGIKHYFLGPDSAEALKAINWLETVTGLEHPLSSFVKAKEAKEGFVAKLDTGRQELVAKEDEMLKFPALFTHHPPKKQDEETFFIPTKCNCIKTPNSPQSRENKSGKTTKKEPAPQN